MNQTLLAFASGCPVGHECAKCDVIRLAIREGVPWVAEFEEWSEDKTITVRAEESGSPGMIVVTRDAPCGHRLQQWMPLSDLGPPFSPTTHMQHLDECYEIEYAKHKDECTDAN
jgi:hypothetical protein